MKISLKLEKAQKMPKNKKFNVENFLNDKNGHILVDFRKLKFH